MKLNMLEKRRQSLIDLWLSLPKPEIEPERREVFQILEGEEQINLKADEILGKAGKEIWPLSPKMILPTSTIQVC